MTEVKITPELLKEFTLNKGERPEGIPDGTLIEGILVWDFNEGIFINHCYVIESFAWSYKEVFEQTGGYKQAIIFWRIAKEQGE